MPWRLSPRGVVVESAAALVGIVAILGAIWVWRSSGPASLPAPAAIVRQASTAEPTPTAAPLAAAVPVTPTTVTAAPTTASVVPAAIEHTIQSGDTLWNLAAEHDTTVEDILAANAGELTLDRLSIGQVIRIPQAGGAPPAAADGADAPTALAAAPVTSTSPAASLAAAVAMAAAQPTVVVVEAVSVTVAAADTLSTLAAAYDVSVDDLVAANNLGDAEAILQVGQPIVVQTAVVVTATPLPGGLAGGQPGSDAGQAALPEPVLAEPASYEVPLMLSPLPETLVVGDAPILRWSSIGPLPPGVGYVVLLRDADAGDAEAVEVPVRGGATAVRIPARFRPALGASRRLAWSVAVGRADDGLLASAEWTILSADPVWGTFTWTVGEGTTPTPATH